MKGRWTLIGYAEQNSKVSLVGSYLITQQSLMLSSPGLTSLLLNPYDWVNPVDVPEFPFHLESFQTWGVAPPMPTHVLTALARQPSITQVKLSTSDEPSLTALLPLASQLTHLTLDTITSGSSSIVHQFLSHCTQLKDLTIDASFIQPLAGQNLELDELILVFHPTCTYPTFLESLVNLLRWSYETPVRKGGLLLLNVYYHSHQIGHVERWAPEVKDLCEKRQIRLEAGGVFK